MSLRDEIAKIIEEENAYGYYSPDRAEELADSILTLIEGERTNYVRCSRCGKRVSSKVTEDIIVRAWVECPECCGKKIEVSP